MNANLIVERKEVPADDADRTALGGSPLTIGPEAWPVCGSCARPLAFLAQLRLRDADPALPNRWLLLFCCQGDATCLIGGQPRLPSHHARCLETLDGPGSLPTATPLPRISIDFVPFDQSSMDYDDARFKLNTGAFVYGMIGGEADSVSGHVPTCDACRSPMRFIASLEEGALFDFAGVQLFAFTCVTCFNSETYVDDFF